MRLITVFVLRGMLLVGTRVLIALPLPERAPYRRESGCPGHPEGGFARLGAAEGRGGNCHHEPDRHKSLVVTRCSHPRRRPVPRPRALVDGALSRRADQYLNSYGACDFEDWRKPEERPHYLFIAFNTLTARDGMDPKVTHEAFLAIPERNYPVNKPFRR